MERWRDFIPSRTSGKKITFPYLWQLWSEDEQESKKVDAKVDGLIVRVMGGE